MRPALFVMVLLLISCRTVISYNNVFSFPNKIENDVIIGFGTPPAYLRNTVANRGIYELRREQYLPSFRNGQKISFWCLATRSRLSVPAEGLQMSFELVDATGRTCLDEELSAEVVTGPDGYNKSEVSARISKTNVYRLKATYRDKNTTSVSYSPNFLVEHPVGTP
jgi:hypothetical protein